MIFYFRDVVMPDLHRYKYVLGAASPLLRKVSTCGLQLVACGY